MQSVTALRQATRSLGKATVHLVTMAVTPQDALKLKTVHEHGEFSLMLRNDSDGGSYSGPSQVSLSDLFDIPQPEARPEPFVAEIYRRGQRNVVTFRDQQSRSPSSTIKYQRSTNLPNEDHNADRLGQSQWADDDGFEMIPTAANLTGNSYEPLANLFDGFNSARLDSARLDRARYSSR